MARIAVVNDATAPRETVYDAFLIGNALAKAGHDIVYVVGDPFALAETAGPDRLLRALQAPSLPRPADGLLGHAGEAPGLAAMLSGACFGDPAALPVLARSWSAILRGIAPDAIVGLAAPVAWLVGPQLAPTLAVGNGGMTPEADGGELSICGSGPDSAAASSNRMLENANAALIDLGFSPIRTLTEALDRCQHWRYGLDEFDPLAAARRVPSVGVLGALPAGPFASDRTRLSMFLDGRYPSLEALLIALSAVRGSHIDLFVAGVAPAVRRFLASRPDIRIRDSLDDALDQAAGAGAIVHHGVPLFAEHGVVHGKPHLVLPWTDGQRAVLEVLKYLGVAWWKEPGVSVEELAGTLSAVLADFSLPAASDRQRGRIRELGISDALVALVETVSEECAGPRWRAATASEIDFESSIEMAVEDSLSHMPAESSADPIVSKVFCAMPFQHMCVGNEGTVRICCMTSDLVSDSGGPMSLYTKSVQDIWNSDYMRDVRRRILADEPLSQCQVCYENENATSTSYRSEIGIRPIPGTPLDIDVLRKDVMANDYRVVSAPAFLKLELGNLCNLKCRMCWGGASSEIERDPVHSVWAGGADPMHAVWQGKHAWIGPGPRIGVRRNGLHAPEVSGDFTFCWTDGDAQFDLPLGASNRPDQIILDFSTNLSYSRVCRVLVNGEVVRTARVSSENAYIAVDLDLGCDDRALTINIQSERSWNRSVARWEGVPIAGIRLQRQVPDADAGRPIVISPRLARAGVWYQNDELLFDELLADAQNLGRLYITGGETLLEPRFEEIVDFLIAKSVAPTLMIELTTNATIVDEQLLDKLAQFKSVTLTISIDGVDKVQEYIRFPSRWPVIVRNVPLLKRANFLVYAIAVVQSYNMLDLANICRFGLEAGIDVSLMNILREPEWLRTSVMPRNVQRVAAERLQQIVDDGCSDHLRTQLLSLIPHFSSNDRPLDTQSLRTFNLFTNDLDVSRGQSFKNSLPELHALIEEAGYRWTDETLHAGRAGERRPARERLHAWI